MAGKLGFGVLTVVCAVGGFGAGLYRSHAPAAALTEPVAAAEPKRRQPVPAVSAAVEAPPKATPAPAVAAVAAKPEAPLGATPESALKKVEELRRQDSHQAIVINAAPVVVCALPGSIVMARRLAALGQFDMLQSEGCVLIGANVVGLPLYIDQGDFTMRLVMFANDRKATGWTYFGDWGSPEKYEQQVSAPLEDGPEPQ